MFSQWQAEKLEHCSFPTTSRGFSVLADFSFYFSPSCEVSVLTRPRPSHSPPCSSCPWSHNGFPPGLVTLPTVHLTLPTVLFIGVGGAVLGFHCCMQASVVVHGLSCPVACGILVLWPGIEPTFPAPLEGGSLTTGPPGKSLLTALEEVFSLNVEWILLPTRAQTETTHNCIYINGALISILSYSSGF